MSNREGTVAYASQGACFEDKTIIGFRGISKRIPYSTLAYIRKHMYWLVLEHEQAGSCQVDWSALPMQNIAGLVPDNINRFKEICWKRPIEALAECLDTHPLLVTLCP